MKADPKGPAFFGFNLYVPGCGQPPISRSVTRGGRKVAVPGMAEEIRPVSNRSKGGKYKVLRSG